MQSPRTGASEINPSSLFKEVSSGKLPWQHLLEKSSKSTVQATAPPNPDDFIYSACNKERRISLMYEHFSINFMLIKQQMI